MADAPEPDDGPSYCKWCKSRGWQWKETAIKSGIFRRQLCRCGHGRKLIGKDRRDWGGEQP